MKKILCVICALVLVLGSSITALAATEVFEFQALSNTVMQSYGMAEKAGGSLFESRAYFTIKKSIEDDYGRTFTSNLVSGDLIDFRSIRDHDIYASKMCTASKYNVTAKAAYLSGMAKGGELYRVGTRTNPSSAHKGVNIAGQWTP